MVVSIWTTAGSTAAIAVSSGAAAAIAGRIGTTSATAVASAISRR
jgi:hypothetical protein